MSSDNGASSKAGCRRGPCLLITVAFVLGVAAAGIPLAVLYENEVLGPDNAASSSSASTTPCWKPLLETDNRGFPFKQQHVAAFLQEASNSTLVMNTMPDIGLAPGYDYDYVAETAKVIERLANITTQDQRDEIAFFDSKLDIALSIIGTLLLGYGQSIEEVMFHSFGETTAVADSGVAVWKNKLMNSRIRPTSVVQQLYPETEFTINQGTTVLGKHFQALVRVMPHSEYPSGSACVCQAIDEFLTDVWPELSLTSAGNSVTFDPLSTPVILPNTAMPSVPLTGSPNPTSTGYSAKAVGQRCGDTRLEGGMHFTPSVEAGRTLCAGLGSATAATMKTLVPELSAGTASLRDAISATAPCMATCCADAVACSAQDQAACAASCNGTWDMPWFDVVSGRMQAFMLPDRATATSTAAPFFQVDRNALALVGIFASLVPEIRKAETIFQLRYTNTIDNLVWNSIAANSATLKALRYGQGHDAAEPIARSGRSTSDARVVTAVHAVAAAIELLLPTAVPDLQASFLNDLLTPTIGTDASLVAACGALESTSTAFDASCLQAWYAADPSPSRLGQVLAYDLMYFKVRDGWNSLGVEGDCNAGEYFCHRYADYTDYDPEVGACLDEKLPTV